MQHMNYRNHGRSKTHVIILNFCHATLCQRGVCCGSMSCLHVCTWDVAVFYQNGSNCHHANNAQQ